MFAIKRAFNSLHVVSVINANHNALIASDIQQSCEWPDISRSSVGQPSTSTSRRPSGSPTAQGVSPLPTELSGQTTVLSITDLRLLQDWTLQTLKGFDSAPEEDVFWQQDLPELGYAHAFLMHILLAASSLQLAQPSPKKGNHFFWLAMMLEQH